MGEKQGFVERLQTRLYQLCKWGWVRRGPRRKKSLFKVG